YEYGEQEELAYLVMPHVTGGTLREVLEKRGRLPLVEVVPIIEQATAALDYAHARGIIHRDLKPGNILFHADGRVVLADFGIAKKPEQRYASAGELAQALRAAIPESSIAQQSSPSPKETVERTTPVVLMSNDTVLDVPVMPISEVPTVKTSSAQIPPHPTKWE